MDDLAAARTVQNVQPRCSVQSLRSVQDALHAHFNVPAIEDERFIFRLRAQDENFVASRAILSVPEVALSSWPYLFPGGLRNGLNGWNYLNRWNALFYIASGKPAITATVITAVSAVKCQ